MVRCCLLWFTYDFFDERVRYVAKQDLHIQMHDQIICEFQSVFLREEAAAGSDMQSSAAYLRYIPAPLCTSGAEVGHKNIVHRKRSITGVR